MFASKPAAPASSSHPSTNFLNTKAKARSRNRTGTQRDFRFQNADCRLMKRPRLKRAQTVSSQSEIGNLKSAILLGAHMTIGGGVHRAIERSRSIDCTAMQIFVKNNMQWFARPLLREEIKAFLDHAQRKELDAAFAHANYLINLAATNPQFHANSLRALSEELVRSDHLELPFLVMHPGAHLGAGEEAGLEKIIGSLDAIWAVIPKVKTKIALETTAGQGSCLGHRFEEIAYIINNVREPERLCVCLDTAHVFAAGYDIDTAAAIKKTFREFDRVIGLDRLGAIHLNDFKNARGSRVHRHAPIVICAL